MRRYGWWARSVPWCAVSRLAVVGRFHSMVHLYPILLHSLNYGWRFCRARILMPNCIGIGLRRGKVPVSLGSLGLLQRAQGVSIGNRIIPLTGLVLLSRLTTLVEWQRSLAAGSGLSRTRKVFPPYDQRDLYNARAIREVLAPLDAFLCVYGYQPAVVTRGRWVGQYDDRLLSMGVQVARNNTNRSG